MLIWWIDSFKYLGGYYRWHVEGEYQDVKFPDASYNATHFSWSVPNLKGGGGRYVFRLRAV